MNNSIEGGLGLWPRLIDWYCTCVWYYQDEVGSSVKSMQNIKLPIEMVPTCCKSATMNKQQTFGEAGTNPVRKQHSELARKMRAYLERSRVVFYFGSEAKWQPVL